jgi:PAS domain S-box-containing protein
MLEQLSEQVRECYERAAEAKARADATNYPALKAAFLDAEKRWLQLARSFTLTERLDDFTAAISKQRRTIDEHPQPNMGSAGPDSAEQILRSIIENSDEAIITNNLDGIISSWNKSAERVFGYTAEEVIGKPVTILIPPERHDEEPLFLERLRSGERIGGAIALVCRHGDLPWLAGRVFGSLWLAANAAYANKDGFWQAVLAIYESRELIVQVAKGVLGAVATYVTVKVTRVAADFVLSIISFVLPIISPVARYGYDGYKYTVQWLPNVELTSRKIDWLHGIGSLAAGLIFGFEHLSFPSLPTWAWSL